MSLVATGGVNSSQQIFIDLDYSSLSLYSNFNIYEELSPGSNNWISVKVFYNTTQYTYRYFGFPNPIQKNVQTRFRIVASNNVNFTNSQTVISNYVTTPTNPDPPTSLIGTPLDNSVKLQWTAPTNTGGTPLVNYYVYVIYSDNTYDRYTTNNGSITEYTAVGLVNGITYSFVISSNNNFESLQPSNRVYITPYVAPDQPTSLTDTPKYKRIELTWVAPINLGGLSIQYYKIYYSSFGGGSGTAQTSDGSTLTYTLSSLTNGITYTIYVTAFNGKESGQSNQVVSMPYVPPPILSSPLASAKTDQNTLAYSDNGYVWKGLGSQIFSSRGNHAAWNGSLWIAVGSGINSIAYSYDGINWTGCGTSILTEGHRVAWNGTFWLAGGNGPYRLALSSDGKIWQGISSIPFTDHCKGLAWNGLRWVAAGSGGSFTLAYSTDGAVWNGVSPTLFSVEGRSVFWGGAYFIAAGEGATHTLAYSSDGISWTGLGKTIFTSYGTDIAWNGTRYVATGVGSTHTLAYSDNGTTWTGNGNTVFPTAGNGVTYNGRVFIAAGEGTNKLVISGDGINWRGVAQSELFTTAGMGVAGVSGLGAVVPRTQIVLSDIPTQGNATIIDNGSRNQLDVVSDRFMDPSLLNIAVGLTTRKFQPT